MFLYYSFYFFSCRFENFQVKNGQKKVSILFNATVAFEEAYANKIFRAVGKHTQQNEVREAKTPRSVRGPPHVAPNAVQRSVHF